MGQKFNRSEPSLKDIV
jgi:hypothetical protein